MKVGVWRDGLTVWVGLREDVRVDCDTVPAVLVPVMLPVWLRVPVGVGGLSESDAVGDGVQALRVGLKVRVPVRLGVRRVVGDRVGGDGDWLAVPVGLADKVPLHDNVAVGETEGEGDRREGDRVGLRLHDKEPEGLRLRLRSLGVREEKDGERERVPDLAGVRVGGVAVRVRRLVTDFDSLRLQLKLWLKLILGPENEEVPVPVGL